MDKKYTAEEVELKVLDVLEDIAYCFGELGLSQEIIDEAFSKRAQEDEDFAEFWQTAYMVNGDSYYFDLLYGKLPEHPDDGKYQRVEARPMEELAEHLESEEHKEAQKEAEEFKKIVGGEEW